MADTCPNCGAEHTERIQPFCCWRCDAECCDECIVDNGEESLCPDCAAEESEAAP